MIDLAVGSEKYLHVTLTCVVQVPLLAGLSKLT